MTTIELSLRYGLVTVGREKPSGQSANGLIRRDAAKAVNTKYSKKYSK